MTGSSIERALEILRNGGLVAIPTETVYGLAGDASNDAAVRRIFEAKGRPADHPLIVHVATPDQLDDWAATVPPAAAVLAGTCWPGPLTLLVPKAAHVLSVVTGGRETVGIRVPAHPLTTELLTRFGGGLAAPSANRFGKVSPTTAAHVVADLGNRVDYVLDGGACPIGVESTIVDCTTTPPQILRPGGIGSEEISALLDGAVTDAAGPSRAPGMLASHYAPTAQVLLVDTAAQAAVVAAHTSGAWILDRSDDLAAYAHSLYAELRSADERGVAVIVAVMPPAAGLGHAIRDRLSKAAAR
ncbi:MAG TPA: L-threonylcarbamoyladenylate synthase [Ilumatobacteraceae bacterium]|nr:L-threonylcarbamoyladenylate synthase [Ilumatobacteraceae bacterium]HRB03434.1 L-threonylcarbamoyladenylate synthase [Ilumatobacteraceae bacterium]